MTEKWNQSWDEEVAEEMERRRAASAVPPPVPAPSGQPFVPSVAVLHCPKCGAALAASSIPNTAVCSQCGLTVGLGQSSEAATPGRPDSGTKTAAIVINALLLPGVGQMMLGRSGPGVVLLIAWIASIALMCVGVGFVTAPVVWLIALIDAASA